MKRNNKGFVAESYTILVMIVLILVNLYFIYLLVDHKDTAKYLVISLLGLIGYVWNRYFRRKSPHNERISVTPFNNLQSFNEENGIFIEQLGESVILKYEEALLLYSAEKYIEAISLFTEALEEVERKIKLKYEEIIKPQRTEISSETISEILMDEISRKNTHEFYYYRGMCYFCTKDYKSAIKDWEYAIELVPEHEEELKDNISEAKKILIEKSKIEQF